MAQAYTSAPYEIFVSPGSLIPKVMYERMDPLGSDQLMRLESSWMGPAPYERGPPETRPPPCNETRRPPTATLKRAAPAPELADTQVSDVQWSEMRERHLFCLEATPSYCILLIAVRTDRDIWFLLEESSPGTKYYYNHFSESAKRTPDVSYKFGLYLTGRGQRSV